MTGRGGKMKSFFSRHKEKENVPRQINTFSFSLYREIKELEGSLFLSPFSISACLAMAYGGARGKTATQMGDVFGFPLDQNYLLEALGNLLKNLSDATEERAHQLSVANAMWGQKGYYFSPKYVELLAVKVGSEVNEVDFEKQPEAACQVINQWVQENTKNKITDIVQPYLLDPLTRLMLTNAVYFKGKWELPFDEDLTDLFPFKMRAGTSETTEVDVAMMKQNRWLMYMENDDLQALELPYEGGELSMMLLLPQEIDGLSDFEASLTHKNLSSWISMLQYVEVEVTLPKFRLTWGGSVGGLLQSMGMKDAFDQETADFSGMADEKGFFLSEILHKAFVDVNEEGTEAAAVTGVAVGLAEPDLDVPPPKIFRADHPFFFLIRHIASGTILFMGRICDTVGLVQELQTSQTAPGAFDDPI
jgi:serpin B